MRAGVEVAEAVNEWLWEATGRRYALDAHYVAKLERGVARWPNAAYRAGLRHVLNATDDAALGFVPTRRAASGPLLPGPPVTPWDTDLVVERAASVADHDLTRPSRRYVLAGVATLAGATLLKELQPLLWPVARQAESYRSAMSPAELDAAERLVSVLRSWHSVHGGLSRQAVAAQLGAHLRRLRWAPHGTPDARRA
ncbi:MAG: hypothetical protein M3422_04190 [Actinomycetota bacterium]|nr:hypothetical protein [Actinomycetota bacterium]